MSDSFIVRREVPKTLLPGNGLPSWTRLEPQSVSGDPVPGLEARVHDPLWLICRQWQLGELEGDDAGSPLGVEVTTSSRRFTRWQAGAWDGVPARPIRDLDPMRPLEPVVESEPAAPEGPGLRERVAAGSAFLSRLDDAGLGGLRDTVLRHAGLDDQTSPDLHDPAWPGLMLLLAGRAVDGSRLASFVDGAADQADGLPGWLAPVDPAQRPTLAALVSSWRAEYAEIAPPPDPDGDAWIGDRIEYRFSIAGRSAGREVVLQAPEFAGGEADWHSFDLGDATFDFDTIDEAPQPAIHRRYATPLRFAGMPSDRLWAYEDAAVNLGALPSEPHDVARLLLVEFALSYGNDWLVVPISVPVGSMTTIDRLTYTTTFGERFRVSDAQAAGTAPGWRMFTVTSADGTRTLDALVVPPAVVATEEGPAYEDVLFLRDENANVVWAVEQTVRAPSGNPRLRRDEQSQPVAPGTGPVTRAELDYQLQRGVPDHWIPYLPRTKGYRVVELAQGRMRRFDPRAGDPPVPPDGFLVPPIGRLLTEPGSVVLADAEVPREGVRLRRVPVLARHADGRYERWIARRVTVGRGEGSSGLAFDLANPRRPAS